MEEELIKIGVAAWLVGVPVTTFRSWRAIRAFAPVFVSPFGTRYYSRTAIEAELFRKRLVDARAVGGIEPSSQWPEFKGVLL